MHPNIPILGQFGDQPCLYQNCFDCQQFKHNHPSMFTYHKLVQKTSNSLEIYKKIAAYIQDAKRKIPDQIISEFMEQALEYVRASLESESGISQEVIQDLLYQLKRGQFNIYEKIQSIQEKKSEFKRLKEEQANDISIEQNSEGLRKESSCIKTTAEGEECHENNKGKVENMDSKKEQSCGENNNQIFQQIDDEKEQQFSISPR